MRKFSIFMSVLLAFSGAASALFVDAPASVPANTSWGFSIAFGPTDSWSSTSIAIDDSNLLVVYSNGTISQDPFGGQFILKSFVYDMDPNSTGGLVLYVSHFGLQAGEHSLAAWSNGEGRSRAITAFIPLGDSDRNHLESSIGSLAVADDEQRSDLDALRMRIARASLDFNNSIKAGMSALRERIGLLEAEQSRLSAALEAAQSREVSASSGFADLVSGLAKPVGFAFLAITIIAIVFGAILFVKGKLADSANPYPKRDEYELPVNGESSEIADALAHAGKWKSKRQ